MYSTIIAPAILCCCGLVFLGLSFAFYRGGRPGKAVFDLICGFSLFIVAAYLLSGAQ